MIINNINAAYRIREERRLALELNHQALFRFSHDEVDWLVEEFLPAERRRRGRLNN